MKRLIFGGLGLVGLLLVVALVAPSFVDWNQYREEIAGQVEELIGKPVSIDGDLDFTVLPSPALSAQNMRIANTPGATTVDFVTLESLDIEVAFFPLLGGEFQVQRTVLVGPVVNLETLPDGSQNWSQPEQPVQLGADEPEAEAFAVSLDRLLIENGTLTYTDSRTGASNTLTNVNTIISAESVTGPFKVDGSVAIDGMATNITLNVGDMSRDRFGVDAIIDLQQGRVTTHLAGVGHSSDSDLLFDGTFEAKADNAGAISGLMNGADGAGDGPAVELTGKAEITRSRMALEGVDITYGSVKGQGELGVAFDDTTQYRLVMTLPVLNVNELIESLGTTESDPSEDTPDPLFPEEVQASVDLSIDGLEYDGKMARQLRIAGDLKDGAFEVRTMRALLPGGSDLSVTGTITSDNGSPAFRGQLRAGSSNFRSLLSTAGMDVADVPRDRLTQMSLTGALTYQGDVMRLTGLDLKVDTTAITGGLAYSLAAERPSLGANLSIDRLNLDLYQTPAGPEDPPMDINNLVAQLGQADLNARLKVGRLVLDGESISALEAAFTTTEGQLAVQQLQIADLAGARIAASEVVLKSGDSLTATGKAQIATTDFKRLLRFAGQDDLPLDLNASSFQTATSFELRDGALGLNGNASLDGTNIVMRAQSGGTGSPLTMQVDIQNPSWADMSRTTGLEALMPLKDGDSPIAIKGTIVGDKQKYDLNLGAEVAGGRATISGTTTTRGAQTTFDLKARLEAARVLPLMRALGFDYHPDSGANPSMTIDATIAGNDSVLQVPAVSGNLGATSFEGQAQVDLRGDRPSAKANLQFRKFDVSAFMDPAETGAAAAKTNNTLRWSPDEIDLESLKAVDMEVALSAEELTFRQYKFETPKLQLNIKDGHLIVPAMTAKLFGGALQFQGMLSAGNEDRNIRPNLAMKFSLDGASVAQALAAAADLTVATGKMSFQGELKATGESQKELISSLGGTMRFSAEDGVVQGVDMVRLSDNMLALVEYQDFINLAKSAMAGGETRYYQFEAPFQVTNGVAKTGPVVAVLDASEAIVNATINLPAWTMDADLDFRLTAPEHAKTPSIGLALSGDIDNPRRRTNTSAMTAYISKRLARRLIDDFSNEEGSSGLKQLLGGETESDQGGNNAQGGQSQGGQNQGSQSQGGQSQSGTGTGTSGTGGGQQEGSGSEKVDPIDMFFGIMNEVTKPREEEEQE